jgi:hypothetical protein
MSGSAAEERIRAKGEAMLRALFPSARIIHELVLKQGGVRIDLAAVTPGRLICIEIKSERDVLTRLPDQVAAMRQVSDAYGVLTAAKHLDKVREIAGWLHTAEEDARDRLGGDLFRDAHSGLCNAPARLDMLWADELRAISCPRRDAPRAMCTASATDTMTGAQVRKAVCEALRARHFPRADEPVLSEMFQRVTRFAA